MQVRRSLGEAAVRAARAVDYVGAGTVGGLETVLISWIVNLLINCCTGLTHLVHPG